jgi:hypothetical protein
VTPTPTIAWRGKLVRLVAQVQQQKPEQGEKAGKMKCICGATVHFYIQSTGISRGHCAAGCGVRWFH